MIWTAAPGLLLATVLVAVLQAEIPVMHIYLTNLLVEAVAKAIGSGPTYLTAVYRLLGWQAALGLLQIVVHGADRLNSVRLAQRASFHIDHLVSEKATNLPLSFFDLPEFYNKFQRASNGQTSRAPELLRSVIRIAQNSLTLVSVITFVVQFHWLLALGIVVAVVPVFLVNLRTGESRFAQMLDQTSAARLAYYFNQLLRGREAAKEIRLFRLAEYLLGRWKQVFWKNANEQFTLEQQALALQTGAQLLGTGASTVSLGLLVWLGAHGNISLGVFVALMQALITAQGQAQIVAIELASLYENALFAAELVNFIDLPEADTHEGGVTSFPAPLTRGVSVTGLTFCYPNVSRPALRDVSFTVRPGERIAIVGENGAGKSTLVKCLLGLYAPSAGTIQYDGTDIRAIERESLYANLSAAFQDYARYYLTWRENIGFGQINRMNDQSELAAAAAKGGAADLLPGLTNGYESMLGPLFDGGRELSQGQWQKVALSRALFRNAQVLVLDEPTASIDPAAEAAMFERFYQFTAGKIAFLISHRMGSCRIADRILVLKDGQLIEDGTHEELMRLNGEYARMVRIQSQWSPVTV
ncbi:MAG TPA: ABC transporter ATP-binding protein [Symbiobacteriaceae bacterium]|nr:ABC transporter ATP-binding protein [Symbiobacteriaceae bacterium]